MSQDNADFKAAVTYSAISDIGMRRTNNQDSYVVVMAGDEESWRRRGHLFIVADGMGAHAAGELASKLAVEGIPHLYKKYKDLPAHEALERAVLETNAEVNRRGEANLEFHKMGTTCSTMALLPQGVVAAHIGDSRIYRLRGHVWEQLTFDHSLVWDLRRSGQAPEGTELAAHLPKNIITRSLGPNPTVEVDLEGPFEVMEGDAFLLCSDGLSGPVEDAEMAQIVAHLPPHEAARVLVDIANLRGGPDNITVIVAKVTGSAVVTGASGESVNAESSAKKVHPGVWAGAAVGVIAAGIFSQFAVVLAVACGVAGLGCLGWGLYLQFGSQGASDAGATGRFGVGPHTRIELTADASLIEKLKVMCADLQEAAKEQAWELPWHVFKEHIKKATAAASANNYGEAIRQYAGAVMFMMRQARSNADKTSSDSSIDLV